MTNEADADTALGTGASAIDTMDAAKSARKTAKASLTRLIGETDILIIEDNTDGVKSKLVQVKDAFVKVEKRTCGK